MFKVIDQLENDGFLPLCWHIW